MTAVACVTALSFIVTVCTGCLDAEEVAAEHAAREAEQQEARLDEEAQRAEWQAREARKQAEHEEMKARRIQTRVALQKEIDALERKTDALKKSIAATSDSVKRRAERMLANVEAHATRTADAMNALADETNDNWFAAEREAEKAIRAFDREVTALEQALRSE